MTPPKRPTPALTAPPPPVAACARRLAEDEAEDWREEQP
jgi:hypothetical protein